MANGWVLAPKAGFGNDKFRRNLPLSPYNTDRGQKCDRSILLPAGLENTSRRFRQAGCGEVFKSGAGWVRATVSSVSIYLVFLPAKPQFDAFS